MTLENNSRENIESSFDLNVQNRIGVVYRGSLTKEQDTLYYDL